MYTCDYVENEKILKWKYNYVKDVYMYFKVAVWKTIIIYLIVICKNNYCIIKTYLIPY